MKKSISNLGKVLNRNQQKEINGGIGICSSIAICPKIDDKYCIVVGSGTCYVAW